MGVNIYTSRRDTFDKVFYWKRNEDIKDLAKYVYETKPDGLFYAKEITPESEDGQQINNAFMFDNTTITIYTEDSVKIEKNDIVKYDDEIWRVVNVQRQHIHKTHQFMKNGFYRTYLQLTR